MEDPGEIRAGGEEHEDHRQHDRELDNRLATRAWPRPADEQPEGATERRRTVAARAGNDRPAAAARRGGHRLVASRFRLRTHPLGGCSGDPTLGPVRGVDKGAGLGYSYRCATGSCRSRKPAPRVVSDEDAGTAAAPPAPTSIREPRWRMARGWRAAGRAWPRGAAAGSRAGPCQPDMSPGSGARTSR